MTEFPRTMAYLGFSFHYAAVMIQTEDATQTPTAVADVNRGSLAGEHVPAFPMGSSDQY